MLSKNRRLISAEEYTTLLQDKKVVKKFAHSEVVLTTFSDGSYAANIEGRSFVYCPE